jgi:hypothetical protein
MNINDLTLGPLKTVAELMDLRESLADSSTPAPRLAFRGQPRSYGTLVPSFQRQFSRQSYATAELIERRLIEDFRVHYGKLRDRSSDMPQPNSIDARFDLRCLSVMQHYEIPTRLLDWTSHFWTALYFACASDPGEMAELWYYDRSLFDAQLAQAPALRAWLDQSPAPPPEPPFLHNRRQALLVELDPQLTPRMKQQAAHHTVSADVFSDHGPLLFALVGSNNAPPSGGLRRFLIDPACKSKALQFLADHEGITASTIFPDVVGLGRFLRWQFESLRTMLL